MGADGNWRTDDDDGARCHDPWSNVREERGLDCDANPMQRGSSCSWTPMLSGTVSRGRKPYCSPATVRLYAWWRWRKEEMEVADR